MNDREALLRAVCENPDDDTPRLVFADWLEEHDTSDNDRARAEFIRLQIHMAQNKEDAQQNWPRWQRLCAREQALLQSHDEDWWRELPEAPGYHLGRIFSRGFIETVWVADWNAFLNNAEALFRSAPVTAGVFRCPVDLYSPGGVKWLSRFRSLNLIDAPLSEADLLHLADPAVLPGLKALAARRQGDRGLSRRLRARFGEHFDCAYL